MIEVPTFNAPKSDEEKRNITVNTTHSFLRSESKMLIIDNGILHDKKNQFMN